MFESFPSINQFRNVVKQVKDSWNFMGLDSEGNAIYKLQVLPKVKFKGTIKLHGQNCAMVFSKDQVSFQSRNGIIDENSSTKSFVDFSRKALETKEFQEKIESLKKELTPFMSEDSLLSVYGEWAGKGIQKGVALSEIDKMFVVFKVKITNPKDKSLVERVDKNELWFPLENLKTNLSTPSVRIYTTSDFPSFEVEVDFEKPEYAQNKFVELTMNVEKECPVGKFFNVSGVGEGIVWSPLGSEVDFIKRVGYMISTFKTKGDKHSSTKVKVVASVDVEKVESLREFVDLTCTESRLNQAVEVLKEKGKPVDVSSTSDFLRWIFADIVKEEQDTMKANNIDVKDLGPVLSKKARLWFMDFLSKDL